MRARIFERGVGETLSSGTGASGAAVGAVLRGAPSPITVELDGGELTVEIGDELEVRLTGTAEPVFAGELSPELLERPGRALGLLAHGDPETKRALTEPSRRLEAVPAYMFAELERRSPTSAQAGIDVISLGIGDPDHPTFRTIVEAMQAAVADPANHRYPTNRGREEFREAFAGFYDGRFGVEIDPETRGDAGDRREGVHLQPLLRVPGPG